MAGLLQVCLREGKEFINTLKIWKPVILTQKKEIFLVS